MELHHLRTFVIVADEASVTKAAQRLFMTPPTISGHVKALEDELGVTLFERTPRGMKLTEKGYLLKEKAENTLFAAQDLVNHATDLQTNLIGEVKVGVNASPNFLQLGALAAALDSSVPGVTLNLMPSASGKIVDALLHKRLDVGFVFGDVVSAEISTIPLATTNLHIALPPAHTTESTLITWQAVAQLPWIYTEYSCPFQTVADQLFAQHALEITRKITSNDEQTRLDLVKAGIGASLLLADECQSAIDGGDVVIWQRNVAQLPLQLAYLAIRQTEPLLAPIITTIETLWT